MTDQFVNANKMVPITPPPELVEEWANASARTHRENGTYAQHEFALATQAARWGADQELEACINAILSHPGFEQPELFVEVLRAVRRPQPPSLKEQALEAMGRLNDEAWCQEIEIDLAVVRKALESLPS